MSVYYFWSKNVDEEAKLETPFIENGWRSLILDENNTKMDDVSFYVQIMDESKIILLQHNILCHEVSNLVKIKMMGKKWWKIY